MSGGNYPSIEIGNTEVIAKKIIAKTGADEFKIVPTVAYPDDYLETVKIANDEQDANARPTYVGDVADWGSYKNIFLGWPKGWAVFRLAKEVWTDEADGSNPSDKDRFQREIFFPIGEPDPYGEFFIGQSYLAPVSAEQVSVFNVTFEPSCRNNWHIHHAKSGGGQFLICVGGRGWYQEEGKEAVELTPGKVINIPANVKHWHGAAADSWMSHLAAEIDGEDASTEWCEPVSEEEYARLK